MTVDLIVSRLNEALNAIEDVERAADGDTLDGWLEQATLALLAAGETLRRRVRDRPFELIAEQLADLDAQLDELELELADDEAAA